jgi:hypothetical protein
MKKKIILDTDMDTDIGDVGAVAVACMLHNLGVIELLGIVVSTNTIDYLPVVVSKICNQYGLGSIPVAKYNSTPQVGGAASTYNQYAAIAVDSQWPTSLTTSNIPDALTTYKAILNAQPVANSVHICAIGGLMAVDQLLTDSATLVSQKIKTLHVSAGRYSKAYGTGTNHPPSFEGTYEFNIFGGKIEQIDYWYQPANRVFQNWPTQVNYVDATSFDPGSGIFSGRDTETKLSANNIVRQCYAQFYTKWPYNGPGGTPSIGRWIWDQMGLFSLAYDYVGFSKSNPGKNAAQKNDSVNIENPNNKNIFTYSATGKDYFYVRDTTIAGDFYSNIVDSLTLIESSNTASSWQNYSVYSGSWVTSQLRYSAINIA